MVLSTYTIALFLPLGPQSLQKLLSGPLGKCLLNPSLPFQHPPVLSPRLSFPHILLSPPVAIDF